MEDSVTGGISRLRPFNLGIEVSDSQSDITRKHVDLSLLESFNIFRGQIVCLEVLNNSDKTLFVKEILSVQFDFLLTDLICM